MEIPLLLLLMQVQLATGYLAVLPLVLKDLLNRIYLHPEIDALAAYYDFLTTHQLTHLRSALDLICCSIPISLWASQLEKANVPLDLIDSLMVLMAATGAA